MELCAQSLNPCYFDLVKKDKYGCNDTNAVLIVKLYFECLYSKV